MTALVGGLSLPFACLLGCVALQRVAELAWSRRNVARLTDPRPSEGRGDYAWMVAAHVALVAAPGVEAALRARTGSRAHFAVGLAAFLAAQALRAWSLASLGRSWNTEAIVAPELGVVTRGPYRWIRHPNYVAVLIEFVALPLTGGAWISLVLLNLAHAPILARRIRGEERQLERIPGYRTAMAGKGRFLPRLGWALRGGDPAGG